MVDWQSESDLDQSSYYSINGGKVDKPTASAREPLSVYDWGNLNDLDSIRNSCDV